MARHVKSSEGAELERGGDPQRRVMARSLQIVEVGELKSLETKYSFFEYIRELLRRSDFITTDARLKAFRTTRSYRWWKFWIVASPLLDALMYGMLFGALLRTSKGVDNFIGFILLGITFFSVISKLFAAGSGLIEANRSLMRAFSFPRASVVLAQSLRYVYDTTPSIVIGIVAALVFQMDKPLSWTVILAIPVFALTTLFGTGLMFIVARLTAFFPDLRAVLDVLVRAWMFLSGVFYSVERYAQDPLIYEIMTFNPGHRFLDAARQTVMYGSALSLSEWTVLVAWGLGTFVVGLIFFWAAEERYVKVG